MHATPDQQTEVQSELDTVAVPVAPPRDPAAYRVTDHYRNRLRDRVRDRDRSTLPGELIREGDVVRARDPDARRVPANLHGTPVAFTTDGPRGQPWTLVAALRPRAFVDDDALHRALTIFQGTPTGPGDAGGDAGGDDDE